MEPGPFGNLPPLAGVRVLDFSHALAGPYCTLLLADYGAEVIRWKRARATWPRLGASVRRRHCQRLPGTEPGGKRGISIDLKQAEGMELCLGLIDKMDVLIENFRPGAMDGLGLGYEAVQRRNPRLVYCSISGYGQNGPSRDEAAMDLVVQSSSGLLSITGTEEGESVRCGYGVTDVTAGLFAVIGILLALRARETTGLRPVCGRLDARQHDFHHELQLHELPGLGRGAAAHGHGLSHGGAVSRLPRVRPGGGDCGGQREIMGGVLPRHRAAGLGEASGLRNERRAHPQPRRVGTAAGGRVRGADGGGLDATACKAPAFRPRSCGILRKWRNIRKRPCARCFPRSTTPPPDRTG